MKKWNFEKQMIVGVLILLFCFVLSTFTKLGIFSNIGWAINGLLFIIHPVIPESWKWRYAGDERKMRRDARIAGAICIFIGVITRFGV